MIYFLNSSISATKQTAKVSKMIVPAHTTTSIVAIFAPSLIWKNVLKTGSGRLQVEGKALLRSKVPFLPNLTKRTANDMPKFNPKIKVIISTN